MRQVRQKAVRRNHVSRFANSGRQIKSTRDKFTGLTGSRFRSPKSKLFWLIYQKLTKAEARPREQRTGTPHRRANSAANAIASAPRKPWIKAAKTRQFRQRLVLHR